MSDNRELLRLEILARISDAGLVAVEDVNGVVDEFITDYGSAEAALRALKSNNVFVVGARADN